MFLLFSATQETKKAHADVWVEVTTTEDMEGATTETAEATTTEATDLIEPELNSKSLLEPSLGSKTKEDAAVT